MSSKTPKRLHVKYALFLSDFNETWNFSTDFRKSVKYQISSKSVQWKPSCFMQTDEWIERKLIVAFRNFAKAPKNLKYKYDDGAGFGIYGLGEGREHYLFGRAQISLHFAMSGKLKKSCFIPKTTVGSPGTYFVCLALSHVKCLMGHSLRMRM